MAKEKLPVGYLKSETYGGYKIAFLKHNGAIRGIVEFPESSDKYGEFFDNNRTKEIAFNRAKNYIDKLNKQPKRKNSDKIKVAYYHYGTFSRYEEITIAELQYMDALTDELDGFDVRPEDRDKTFYADPSDIDYEEGSGYGVKFAYATDMEIYN